MYTPVFNDTGLQRANHEHNYFYLKHYIRVFRELTYLAELSEILYIFSPMIFTGKH